MPAVHLRRVHVRHAGHPVLVGVDLDVAAAAGERRWFGVVGANGAGKSTLLDVVAGRAEPSAGSVAVDADLLVHVSQLDDRAGPDVLALHERWDGFAAGLKARLDLGWDDVEHWATLSPGQRRRWGVAAALAREPDVLLLDEPTNHLDRDARDLLVDVLAEHRGLGLIVAHDRAVLDRLTDTTVRVHDGTVTLHAGPVGEAMPRWRAATAAEREAHGALRREERRVRRALGDVRRDRHGAEVRGRGERRRAGPAESDARETGRKAAQAKAEAALAARVGQLRTRADQLASAAADSPAREHRGPLELHARPARRPVLARLRGDVAHAGGEVLLRDVDVALGPTDRVDVTGPNGAGKTTLVQALLRVVEAPGVGVLPQEVADPAAVVADVHDLPPEVRGRVLGAGARLGLDVDALLRTTSPSPGEARKLLLAQLLVADHALLVLDEPTNHLDLEVVVELEEALAGWPAALLLVTHDRRLAERVTAARWRVGDGRVVVEQPGDLRATAAELAGRREPAG